MFLFGSETKKKFPAVKSVVKGSVPTASQPIAVWRPEQGASVTAPSNGLRSFTSTKTATLAIDYDYPPKRNVVLPGKVRGRYKSDFDLITVHKTIREAFSYYHYHRDAITKKIAKLLDGVDKYTTLETISRKKEASELQKELETFSEESWDLYVAKVKPLFEKYLPITIFGKSQKYTFGAKSDSDITPEQAEERLKIRLDIIEQFLRITKDYLEVDVVFHSQTRYGCTDCGKTVDQMEADEDQGGYYCDCGIQFDHMYSTEAPHQDPDRIEPPSRGAYEARTNFIRQLHRYQGMDDQEIPASLIDTLDAYFQERCGLSPAAEIRMMDMDKWGHRGKETSIKLLEYGLSETNNPDFYKNMDSIAHRLWGWKLHDVSHLEPRILDDYARTEDVRRQIRIKGSSLNVNLRLYWHLRAAGHECRLEDFKIPSGDVALKKASMDMRMMCEQAGVEFYPIM